MEYLKNLFSRYWRTLIIVLIGIVLIVYIAFGFLFLQQGNLQREAEVKIEQIKPVLSKELPSRAELQAEYDAVVASLGSLTDGEVIKTLVKMAQDNGIDVREESGNFQIPIAGYGSITIGNKTYRLMKFNGIKVQGEVDEVMNFISDIQSGKNIETMKLSSLSVAELHVPYDGEEGARRTEFRAVIQAVSSLIADNELQSIPNPISYSGGLATNFMGDNPETEGIIEGFPDNVTSSIEKGYTGNSTIKSGYVLFEHHKVNPEMPTLYSTVNYYSNFQTSYYYTCESNGLVRQWSNPDITTAIEYTETESSRMELAVMINIEILYGSE